MMHIDGPRMPPAGGGKAQGLVILLHGYGSNGEDLISLAPYWAKLLPNAAFVSPNAPERVPGLPGGYQWFPITRLDPHLMEAGVRQAASHLDRFIDRELERTGLPPEKVALVGFSQGTMMALHVGLRRERALAGIIGYSGALPGGAKLKGEVRSKPPILLAHGDRDDVIPVTALLEAADALGAAGLSAQWRISPGIPHSIGPDGLDMGGQFLKAALGGKLKTLA